MEENVFIKQLDKNDTSIIFQNIKRQNMETAGQKNRTKGQGTT